MPNYPRTTTFRLFFDMDGVLVDFERFLRELNADPTRALPDGKPYTGQHVKVMLSAYLEMKPIDGALDGIRKVMSIAGMYGGEVWLASKPPHDVPWACADKVSWVHEHLPELKRRVILTQDKGLLGGVDDFLVDDMPHRANCANFKGTLIHFGHVENPDASCARHFASNWSLLVYNLHTMMRKRAESSGPRPAFDPTFYAGARLGKPYEEPAAIAPTCASANGCTNAVVCTGRGTCSPFRVVRTGEHNGGPYDTRN